MRSGLTLLHHDDQQKRGRVSLDNIGTERLALWKMKCEFYAFISMCHVKVEQ